MPTKMLRPPGNKHTDLQMCHSVSPCGKCWDVAAARTSASEMGPAHLCFCIRYPLVKPRSRSAGPSDRCGYAVSSQFPEMGNRTLVRQSALNSMWQFLCWPGRLGQGNRPGISTTGFRRADSCPSPLVCPCPGLSLRFCGVLVPCTTSCDTRSGRRLPHARGFGHSLRWTR